ncbi:ABC transporter permease [Phnomibacter sp. MR]|uniref:ABC transporter permease n=1 Tax=Phnomibacter sp. MR TaxID=3042318 RepID=UPI003A80E934
MQALFLKELRQFFSSLTGYLSIGLFLLLMGLFLFVFPDTSIFDFGYATLDKYFELAPWVLLLLVPAVTMRSLSDEFRSGTWELLKTRPVSLWQIVWAKYAASLTVVLLALLPTLLYVVTISMLSINGSIDTGGIAGSYIGLILLAGAFTAIGIASSALTANPIVSFLLAAFMSFVLYSAFAAVAGIPALQGGTDYWVALLGMDEHYKNVSRGVLALNDVVYFSVIIGLFLYGTRSLLARR